MIFLDKLLLLLFSIIMILRNLGFIDVLNKLNLMFVVVIFSIIIVIHHLFGLFVIEKTEVIDNYVEIARSLYKRMFLDIYNGKFDRLKDYITYNAIENIKNINRKKIFPILYTSVDLIEFSDTLIRFKIISNNINGEIYENIFGIIKNNNKYRISYIDEVNK